MTLTEHLDDEIRRFTLTPQDLQLINPNTRTTPIFRTKVDAELTKKIYGQVPVLIDERAGKNPWSVSFLRMFDMTNDSHLFFTAPSQGRLPLYEGKMIKAYDHRAASVITKRENIKRPGQPVATRLDQYADPNYSPTPQYWVEEPECYQRLHISNLKWLLAFKEVTSATNERTFVATAVPFSGVGNTMPLILIDSSEPRMAGCLLANLNSLVLDFVARQKVGGLHLNYFVVKQLPVLPPSVYGYEDVEFITERVLELVYTSWDMRAFAQDMGRQSPPFEWNEERRAALKAELDAYYAYRYGLTRVELRYILDPEESYGSAFPGETFRSLKERETKTYGEYRTKRLVLEAWDKLFG